MNEKPHQVMEDQNDRAQKGIVLRAEVAPSLKCGFLTRIRSAGFASEADAIRTLARDFVTGRIQYIGGMLRSQEKNCENGPPAMPIGLRTEKDPSAAGGPSEQSSSPAQSQQTSQPAPSGGQQGVSRASGTLHEKNQGGR